MFGSSYPPVLTQVDDYPPLPSLPPASELRRYGSSPPDSTSQIRRYHDYAKAVKIVCISYDAPSVEQKLTLLRGALLVFPFCVDALNAWAEIYLHSFFPPPLERAEETYKLALSACRLLWPDMEQKPEIDYCHEENHPFLYTYYHLGNIQRDMRKFEDAIEKFRFLLRVNPNDDLSARTFLFMTLIVAGGFQDYSYKLAEEELKKYTGGRKSTNAFICYDYVIVDSMKVPFGFCTEANQKATLVRALTRNLFVPSLLLGEISSPYQRQDGSSGSMHEALRIVYRIKETKRDLPPMLEWLREQQHSGGKKPNDDGTILFQLLQKGSILVRKKDSYRLWRLTTDVSQMSGQVRPDFCLAPGMKEHNPVKIVAFDKDKIFTNDGPFLANFTSFSYDDVAEIPFWNILFTSKAFGKVKQDCSVCCEQTGTLTCSVCKVVRYCSRTCQKKDWKAGHKAQCPKFIKT